MAVIFLTCGATAEIDDEDAPLVLKTKWHLHISRHHGKIKKYARGWVAPKKRMYLHRFLMKTPSHLQVDHLDNNGLNCRRSNMQNVMGKTNNRRQHHRIKQSKVIAAEISVMEQSRPEDAIPF